VDERGGNADHLVIRVEFCAGCSQQIARFRVLDLDPGALQKLIGFLQDLDDDLVTEKGEFWLYGTPLNRMMNDECGMQNSND
jgi:hypothetical protein